MNPTILKLVILLLLISNLHSHTNNSHKNNEIILQLQWKNQFQFAGYYIAKEKGFYKDLNINVKIKEKTYGQEIVDEVINKKAHFAIGRSSLVLDRAKNKKIVLLASILQSSPQILLTLKKSNINKIEDFKNKRIMITGNAKNDIVLKSMFFSKKINDSDKTIKEMAIER